MTCRPSCCLQFAHARTQINAYARRVIGFSATDSVQLLLIMNGMTIPFRPVVGYLADRYFGPINLFAFHMLVLGGLIFAWPAVASPTGMYVFTVFFGLTNGNAQGLFAASLASLTRDPKKMGTRFGMVNTMVGFASLAGPPTAGALIDRARGSFFWAQMWAGSVIVLAAAVMAWARCAKTGWQLWVKI